MILTFHKQERTVELATNRYSNLLWLAQEIHMYIKNTLQFKFLVTKVNTAISA